MSYVDFLAAKTFFDAGVLSGIERLADYAPLILLYLDIWSQARQKFNHKEMQLT